MNETGDIGLFLITSEGSAAAGVRRIEAMTGRGAYELVQKRLRALKQAATMLSSPLEEVPIKTQAVIEELEHERKQSSKLRQALVAAEFKERLEKTPIIKGVPVLAAVLQNADVEALRQMCDQFRQKFNSGVVVLGSAPESRPVLIAAVTDDLVKRGLLASDIVRTIAQVIGGSGGGKPNLAQAGGKDASQLQASIDQVLPLVQEKL